MVKVSATISTEYASPVKLQVYPTGVNGYRDRVYLTSCFQLSCVVGLNIFVAFNGEYLLGSIVCTRLLLSLIWIRYLTHYPILLYIFKCLWHCASFATTIPSTPTTIYQLLLTQLLNSPILFPIFLLSYLLT